MAGSGSTGESAPRAPLVEIFDSIQGEGRFVGVPMSFVRVATCPIRCSYCDTPDSYQASATCAVRHADGCVAEPNPVGVERTVELIGRARGRDSRTTAVSITGGEPLVVPRFVAALGAALRARAERVHLETAALDPAALQQVLAAEGVDHVSADYKLPGTLADRGDHSAAHLECIRIAVAAGVTVDVKLVLAPGAGMESVEDALQRLRPFAAKVLVVLQPVTPFGAVTASVTPSEVLATAHAAARAGLEVRVIPQTHKTLGID